MKKKLRHKKNLGLLTAVVAGLLIGLLIIPGVKDYVLEKTGYKSSTPSNNEPQIEQSGQPLSAADLKNEKNWTTYRNDEYNMSFNYPSGLVTNVFNEPDQEIDSFIGVDFGRKRMPERTVYQDDFNQLGYVIAVRIDRVKTLNEVSKEIEAYKNRDGYRKEDVLIDGVKGIKYVSVGEFSSESKVIFERKKMVFIFTMTRYGDSQELFKEGEEIFERMIQSITFR